MSKRRDCRLDPRNVAVVVGAPDVDQGVEAALKFVEVVGDVGSEIGVLAVLALDDAILLVAEIRGTEPSRAILFVEMACLFEHGEGIGHPPRFIQRSLREPVIECHAKSREHVADLGNLAIENEAREVLEVVTEKLARAFDQCVHARFDGVFIAIGRFGQRLQHSGCSTLQALTVRRFEFHGAGAHVVSLVGVRRKRQRHAAQSPGSAARPIRQDVHLPAGIVDVILTGNHIAGGIEQVRQACAVGRATAVADMQRAGRICGDELHLHFFPAAGSGTAKQGAAIQDFLDGPLFCGGLEVQIDESCAGDLGLVEMWRGRQALRPVPARFARIALHRLCQLHREAAGVVAVLDGLRSLELDGCRIRFRGDLAPMLNATVQSDGIAGRDGRCSWRRERRWRKGGIIPARLRRPAHNSTGSTSSDQRTRLVLSAEMPASHDDRKRCSAVRDAACTSSCARWRPATRSMVAGTGS